MLPTKNPIYAGGRDADADFDEELDSGLDDADLNVRPLGLDDLNVVVDIDENYCGVRRMDYFKARIERSLTESSLNMSLAAEKDGMVVGFVTATFHQGEFGLASPRAMLDTIGVHPEYRGSQVGLALMRQLTMNLKALHVESITTEVEWDDFELLGFFARSGFEPSTRLVLTRPLIPA
jgi:ribosomal protein S18 acetylase RimI-like enzyme